MKLLQILAVPFLLSLPVLLTAQKKQIPKTRVKTAVVSKEKKGTQTTVSTSTQPFQLTVTAKGFSDSMQVSLRSMTNQQYLGPEGILKGGKVLLEGDLPQADGYAVVFSNPNTPGDQQGYPVYISNAVYRMEVDKAIPNVVKVVSGDADSKAFSGLISGIVPYFMELNQLGALQQQYQQMGRPADSLRRRQQQIFAGINTLVPQFIARQPASPVSAFAIKLTQQAMQPDQLQRNLAMLQGDAAADPGIQQMKQAAEAEKMFAEGNPAPEFSQNDTLGKPVSLGSFKG